MILTILSSSSKGNCYLLHNENECLIIEAGISFKRVKEAIDFNVNKILGVLVSHEHLDHSKYFKDYISSGIKVLSPLEVYKFYGLENEYIEIEKTHNWGNFKIKAFPVMHDVPCYGFLISHPETGKILFLTDTYYSPWVFSGLNQIMVEANYCEHILQENIEAGKVHPKVRERILRSHMSINTCKELLSANDLSQVRNIVLIHLSDSNSNAEDFKKQVVELTGKTVYTADKDITIDFNLKPF